jgi:hypothetical protein
MIPPFNEDGNLPPGVHWATWDELFDRFAINDHRVRLLDGLAEALALLASADCETAYIDGSFVTGRPAPNDVDVVWETRGVDFLRLDPIFFACGPQRQEQVARFGCELFPSDIVEGSSGISFVEYFQRTADHRAKGIIAIELRRTP